MATAYTMKQYRYNGEKNSLMSNIPCSVYYLDWRWGDEKSPYYRDILIKPDSGTSDKALTKEQGPYYFKFGVPRDLNYHFNFSVKLLNNTSNFNQFVYDASLTNYQFLRYVSAAKTASDGSNHSLVTLYKLPSNDEPYVARSDNKEINADLDTIAEKETIKTGIFYRINNPVGLDTEASTREYAYYPKVLYYNTDKDAWWYFEDVNDFTGVETISGDNEGKDYVIDSKTEAKTYLKGKADTTKQRYIAGSKGDPWGRNNILQGTSDAVLTWLWQTEQQQQMVYYDMVFVPQAGFEYILLQLERISEDSDIITKATVGDTTIKHYLPSATNAAASFYSGQAAYGEKVYGRYVDLSANTGQLDENGNKITVADTFKLYKLTEMNDINGKLSHSGTINRIGVWGHPELLMAINGEEIRIGSSGYYELNDFEITNFSVVADGPQDMFTVDYQFKA